MIVIVVAFSGMAWVFAMLTFFDVAETNRRLEAIAQRVASLPKGWPDDNETDEAQS